MSSTSSSPLVESIMSLETPVLLGLAVGTISVLFLAYTILLKPKKEPAMSPTDFRQFKLVEKESLSHDTRKFTFELQTPETVLGLPVGQHITLRFQDSDGKRHQRSYTPITGDETLGKVVFVIKVYKAGVHPKFPLGGKMSQHLDSLQIGDFMEMKGPKGHLTYFGKGKFTVKQMRKPLEERKANHFGLIAGGTGITPIMQLVRAIFRDEKDNKTTMSVLYANQTEDDILLREELESFASKYPARFRVHYTLDRPPSDWKYSTGFINKEMLEKHISSGKGTDGKITQVLMCGPPPMLKFACIPNLDELGFSEKDYFCY